VNLMPSLFIKMENGHKRNRLTFSENATKNKFLHVFTDYIHTDISGIYCVLDPLHKSVKLLA
jgi:hypothetical protein